MATYTSVGTCSCCGSSTVDCCTTDPLPYTLYGTWAAQVSSNYNFPTSIPFMYAVTPPYGITGNVWITPVYYDLTNGCCTQLFMKCVGGDCNGFTIWSTCHGGVPGFTGGCALGTLFPNNCDCGPPLSSFFAQWFGVDIPGISSAGDCNPMGCNCSALCDPGAVLTNLVITA
jgi:hypothetical protein